MIAVSPACFIHPDLCGSVVNLCSRRDFVPLGDFVNGIRHRNTVVFINPSPRAGLLDHTLLSPTFTNYISWYTNEIIRIYGKGGL